MSFDDRLRKALQRAIPADPPPNPDALADELIRRAAAGGGGGRGGGGGGKAALWIAGLAVAGAAIGAAIGLSGLLGASSSTTAATTTVPATTTEVSVTTTAAASTRPSTTTMVATTTASPATTSAPATSGTTATTAADTAPPFVGQVSVGADPIWELDTEGIPCGGKPRQSTVTVGVSDDRGVASVTLSWQFPGGPGGSTAMSGSGTYSATFGPFPYLTVPDNTSQVAMLTVTAVDAAGNTASSQASITVFSTSTCFG